MTYAGLDFTTADEDLETGLGAAMSGYPVNHIQAGDIASDKMIEGLDPSKATPEDCAKALEIFNKHHPMRAGLYEQQGGLRLTGHTYTPGGDISITTTTKDGHDTTVSPSLVAFEIGQLFGKIPKEHWKDPDNTYGPWYWDGFITFKKIEYLASAINTWASSLPNKTEVLGEISQIQTEKGATLA